jgi:hypothetical protein
MQRLGVGGWLFGAGLDHGSMGITYPTIKPRFDQNSSSRPHFRTPVKQLSKSQSPLVITSPFWTPLASPGGCHRSIEFSKKKQRTGESAAKWMGECLNQCFVLFFQVMTPVKRLQRRALLALYWLKVHQFLLCSMFCSWDLKMQCVTRCFVRILIPFCTGLSRQGHCGHAHRGKWPVRSWLLSWLVILLQGSVLSMDTCKLRI